MIWHNYGEQRGVAPVAKRIVKGSPKRSALVLPAHWRPEVRGERQLLSPLPAAAAKSSPAVAAAKSPPAVVRRARSPPAVVAAKSPAVAAAKSPTAAAAKSPDWSPPVAQSPPPQGVSRTALVGLVALRSKILRGPRG